MARTTSYNQFDTRNAQQYLEALANPPYFILPDTRYTAADLKNFKRLYQMYGHSNFVRIIKSVSENGVFKRYHLFLECEACKKSNVLRISKTELVKIVSDKSEPPCEGCEILKAEKKEPEIDYLELKIEQILEKRCAKCCRSKNQLEGK